MKFEPNDLLFGAWDDLDTFQRVWKMQNAQNLLMASVTLKTWRKSTLQFKFGSFSSNFVFVDDLKPRKITEKYRANIV